MPSTAEACPGDVVFTVALGAAALDEVTRQARGIGVPVVVHDLEGGLAGVAEEALVAGATIVHLPALLGRFLPRVPPSAEGRVTTVVVHAPAVDPASVGALRTAFGAEVALVLWPPADLAEVGPAAWATAAELASSGRDAGVAVILRPDGSTTAWEPCRTASEQLVARVAAEVVGRTPVGRIDHLGDLGVTGETALWFLDRLGDETGRRLRLGDLVAWPTVAELAGLLDAIGEGTEPERRPLAHRVGPSWGGPSLFVLHDRSGRPDGAAALAGSLPPSVSVVALESPMLTGQDPAPFATLELLAARYVRDVRRVQPTGPYLLAGWGFGALAAFEVARRLLTDGDRVGFLGVAAAGPGQPTSVGRPAAHPLRRLRSGGRPPVGALAPPDRRLGAVRAEHDRLAATWVPKPCPVRIGLTWPTDLGSTDASLGWQGLTDIDVAIARIAVPHVPEPDLTALAAWATTLADQLDRSSPRPNAPIDRGRGLDGASPVS